jgi:beta-lactamase class A
LLKTQFQLASGGHETSFFCCHSRRRAPFHWLAKSIRKIAPAAKGRVGVAAQILESGETADLHGDEHFPMHSVAADLDGGLAAR